MVREPVGQRKRESIAREIEIETKKPGKYLDQDNKTNLRTRNEERESNSLPKRPWRIVDRGVPLACLISNRHVLAA